MKFLKLEANTKILVQFRKSASAFTGAFPRTTPGTPVPQIP